MNYYLKNFQNDTVQFLGTSDDLNGVTRRLIALVKKGTNLPCWQGGNIAMDAFFNAYNQTGKDTFAFHTCTGHMFVQGMAPIPIYDFAHQLRPWLIVDEDGRHIALDEVKHWVTNYRPAQCVHPYWGAPPDATRGRRWNWPTLLARTNRMMDDPDAKAEVEELAGAHIANKLFSHKLEGWKGLYWDSLEEKACRRRPHKSWKNKKCSRQWQKKKKCGQRPSRPIPVESSDVIDDLVDFSDSLYLEEYLKPYYGESYYGE